ncbi:uncharacterized protein LOC134262693 [Saccostrea cucullata]|uniref:uncharacterized protein LOC134262693 n=1 Tax=Saccostrea cuccullata TaxID=36930 RepID=UPI002ED3FB31
MDKWRIFLVVCYDLILLVRADTISTPDTCQQDSDKTDYSKWEVWNLVIYILIGGVVFFAFCCCFCAHFVNWKRRKQSSESPATPDVWNIESSIGNHSFNGHINPAFSSSDTINRSQVPSAPLYTAIDLPPSYESVMEQINKQN